MGHHRRFLETLLLCRRLAIRGRAIVFFLPLSVSGSLVCTTHTFFPAPQLLGAIGDLLIIRERPFRRILAAQLGRNRLFFHQKNYMRFGTAVQMQQASRPNVCSTIRISPFAPSRGCSLRGCPRLLFRMVPFSPNAVSSSMARLATLPTGEWSGASYSPTVLRA